MVRIHTSSILLFDGSFTPGTVTNVTTEYSISSHEISCCGVGLSPDSSLVAVGDLTGNVYLYSCDEGGPQWPLEMWNVNKLTV